MENCLFRHQTSSVSFRGIFKFSSLPSCESTVFGSRFGVKFGESVKQKRISPSVVAIHCDFSSLNAPLEPRSPAGKYLSSVLQNHPQLFHIAAADELRNLADVRDDAVRRMEIQSDSGVACLHRRIAQLKERECQLAVEDVIYMLVFYKFSTLKVPLVPKLSSCIYNRRLEILPSKDWQLESVHSFEVLELIREHVTAVIGLRANSSVVDNWATTQMQRFQFGRIYAASILYGYFLKSASLRLHLEQRIALDHQDLNCSPRTSLKFPDTRSYKLKKPVFGHIGNTQSTLLGQESNETKRERLRCYVMGFDPETLQRCAKLKSAEAMSLVEKHTRALFGDNKGSLETDEVIVTSFSSLKRLILEAVAFGSFLWDAEEYVGSIYGLKEN